MLSQYSQLETKEVSGESACTAFKFQNKLRFVVLYDDCSRRVRIEQWLEVNFKPLREAYVSQYLAMRPGIFWFFRLRRIFGLDVSQGALKTWVATLLNVSSKQQYNIRSSIMFWPSASIEWGKDEGQEF